jgi:hypothetical protein
MPSTEYYNNRRYILYKYGKSIFIIKLYLICKNNTLISSGSPLNHCSKYLLAIKKLLDIVVCAFIYENTPHHIINLKLTNVNKLSSCAIKKKVCSSYIGDTITNIKKLYNTIINFYCANSPSILKPYSINIYYVGGDAR